MSAATGAVCTVTAPDPDTEIEGWTASASTSPGFRTVSVTVMISLGKAPGGKERTASRTTALKRMTVHRSGPSEIGPHPVESVADEDDANVAGVDSTAWYTPCAAPLPNGPRTVSPYIPAVTPAGTTAASVWESIQRTSRSSTWPSEALKSASSARCDPALRCCTTEGSKPSPCSRTGVSRLTYPAAGSTEAGEGGEGGAEVRLHPSA